MKANQQQNFETLNCIPRILTDEDRSNMERWPDEAEIRAIVFDLNKNSVSGTDGFSGDFFFQSCWDIVKQKVNQAVM